MIKIDEANGTMEQIEPKDYFADLKTKITDVQFENLERNREFIAAELQKAHALGQKNLTHKAAFMWEILEKEMILHAMGITKYLHRDDVVKFIDNVKPKNSVKIVELENYPRSVPDQNMFDIIAAKNLNLFDVMLVLYTDLTNEEVHSPEQKAFAARNRDPVVFGMFVDDKINVKHDRLYFITDWEDEFCELTFSKMIDKMSEPGADDPQKNITVDGDHISRLAAQCKVDIEKIDLKTSVTVRAKPKTFISKILDILKNDS